MRISRASMTAALVLLSACADSIQAPTHAGLTPIDAPAAALIHPGSGSYQQRSGLTHARNQLAAAVVGTRIVTVGGMDPTFSFLFPVIEAYSPETNTGTQAVAQLAEAAYGLMAAGWDRKLYVMGGLTFTDALSTLHVFNRELTTRTQLANMPRARRDGAAVAVDGKIYVFAGAGLSSPISEVDVYDIATNSWSQVAPYPRPDYPQARAYVIGRKIYVWRVGLFSFDIYDIDSNSWSVSATGWPGGGYASGGVVDGRIYMFVAIPGTRVAAGYDPATDSWQTVAVPPVNASATAAGNASYGGKVYSLLGGSGPQVSIWAFTPGNTANHYPSPNLQGPYRGAEGAGVAFANSAADPDGDALSYAWTFGDGGTSTDASPTHTYDDDGEYPVTLTVTDPEGKARTATTRAVIRNVAPSVSGIAKATIIAGTAYSATGTISDPGDDTFTATVDWGQGGGPVSHPVTGNSISLNHTYATPGYYNIVVRIFDGDGGSVTVSRWVRVKASPDV